MVNPGTVLAHFIKLIVTIVCLQLLDTQATHDWARRAFQMLLADSLLGIYRYGGPGSKFMRFRSLYDYFSDIIEVLPFALFTSAILYKYRVYGIIRHLSLALNTVPIFFGSKSRSRGDVHSKLQFLMNVANVVQLLILTITCLYNANYNVISLSVSYVFARYLAYEFSDRYDVPYTDLTQYCLSFVEIFAVATIKEL